jgi:hypothetical protein
MNNLNLKCSQSPQLELLQQQERQNQVSFSTVKLTWYEAAMASNIGLLRQLSSIKTGRVDQHGFNGIGWDVHIEGACGELAVAKLLSCYWDGSVDTFKTPDISGNLQVRTRSNHTFDLLVRPNDNPLDIYCLVTGKCPEFRVHGWIQGLHAQKPEWKKNHGGRPPAWFVPQTALNPMSNLLVTDST